MHDVGTVLRGVVAMLFAGAGLLHVDAAIGHPGQPRLQAAFALAGALQVAVGGLALGRRRRLGPLLAAGMALQVAAVGAWLLSRTRGLPEIVSPGGHVEPVGVTDAVCVALELASLPLCVLLLSGAVRRWPVRSPLAARRALAVAATVVGAVLVPAFAVTGATPLRLGADVLEGGPHAGAPTHASPRAGHRGARQRSSEPSHARGGAAHTRHAAGAGDGAQLASAGPHAGHVAAAGGGGAAGHAGHDARGGAGPVGGGRGDHGDHAPQRPSGGHGDHSAHAGHGGAPAGDDATGGQPAPPAQAAAAPPPDPCAQGTTLVDAGGTQVVVDPSGPAVRVC